MVQEPTSQQNNQTESVTRPPIFILGVSMRSGTNFLHDLIRLHPDCAIDAERNFIWEDFHLHHADSLLAYAHQVSQHWSVEATDAPQAHLLKSLGDGILAFLSTEIGGQRLLTKTPGVQNLSHFFKLFPDAQLLVIVRDGRSVAESGARGFGWNLEAVLRYWSKAAQTILDFQEVNPLGKRWLLIRYEDVVASPQTELLKILEFLGLEPALYDFEAACGLPVRGSSLYGKQADQVHWTPIDRPADFTTQAATRFKGWSPWQHSRANHLAGRQLAGLGYTLEPGLPTGLERLGNLLADARWQLREILKGVYHQLRSWGG